MPRDFFLKNGGVGKVEPLAEFLSIFGRGFESEELLDEIVGAPPHIFSLQELLAPRADNRFDGLIDATQPVLREQFIVVIDVDCSADA